MVENPYPIPRQLRLSDILVGDGGDTYGPFDFEIFDPADVVACICPANGLRFVEVPGIVVTKVNGNTALNPLDNFTVRFPFNVESTTRYVVLSSRVSARDAGVISGTRINPDALEKEFSKIATQQQELRRDIGRAIMTDFGAPSFTLDASIDDGRTLMVQGDRLVAGPDLQAIGDEVEAVKDLVEGWASDIVSQGNVPLYAALMGITALVIPLGISAFRVNGFWSAGDGGQALYKKVEAEPGHPGKVRSADGAWWEIAEPVLNVRMFGAKLDVAIADTVAVRNAMQAAFVTGRRAVTIPGGVISFSGIDMTLYKGVSLVAASSDAVLIVPDANNVTIFTDINPSASGSNYTLGPFSILCESGAIVRTGVRALHAIHANRIRADLVCFGCAETIVIDRGGLHDIRCQAAPTQSLPAGKGWLGSSVDGTEAAPIYGAVFSTIDYRIDGGSGAESPALIFRRAVAIKGRVISNNSDYTGTCVAIENDCQGLDLDILAVGYEHALTMGTGPGLDKAPIFNTIRLEADQCTGVSLYVNAAQHNDLRVMITSSFIGTAQTAVLLEGSKVVRNKVHGRVSGYYDPLGTGCTLVNTAGNSIDLCIVGCNRGFVDGGGNTHTDITGDVRENVTSKVVGPFSGVGNRLHDIKGYSGTGVVSTPPIPSSGVPATNVTGHDVRVFFTGGTVSTISVNGQGIGYSSGLSLVLKPGETIAWNGSAAPNWWWIAF